MIKREPLNSLPKKQLNYSGQKKSASFRKPNTNKLYPVITLRKPISNFKLLITILKISVSVIPLLLFFSGYQPVLAIPPVRRSIALADFSQTQSIKAANIEEPFSLPHSGYISNHFSPWHPAIDIAADLGTAIHPVLKGKVIAVVYGLFDLGHYVIVEHDQGYQSTYGHMGRILVKIGDAVTTLSILGEVGLTGHTSGPHTHLEITRNGNYVDPQTLLPPLPNL